MIGLKKDQSEIIKKRCMKMHRFFYYFYTKVKKISYNNDVYEKR